MDRASQTCQLERIAGCSIIGESRGSSAHLHRPWRASSILTLTLRAHLVGAYSLGKAQRMIAVIREAGYDAPIYLHGAMEKITEYYVSRGIALGELRSVRGVFRGLAAGLVVPISKNR